METKTGFFQIKPGNYSITRLMTFMALCTAIILVFCTVFVTSVTFGDTFPLILTLLGYSLGAKAFQNVTERVGKDKK